ncbi:hypothetical protein GcM3_063021 [Golovinomyces cichoracearum]|uniref:Uncharacterized protein n=1 Tax=Golovinomyces cichoracearum TaxID=62708 RepID=A0A420IVC8_9PEZI|nr:hypothetical protein GcM3_063021 [Golovinomyces cichoracearum]
MPTYITPTHNSSDTETNPNSPNTNLESLLPITTATSSESSTSSPESFFEAREMAQNISDFVSDPMDTQPTVENNGSSKTDVSNELKFAT